MLDRAEREEALAAVFQFEQQLAEVGQPARLLADGQLGARVRQSALRRVPYVAVIGKREAGIRELREALGEPGVPHRRALGVAPAEPDPRGWTVRNREGRAVGEPDLVRGEAIKALAHGNPDLAQRALNRERQANKIFVLLLRLIFTAYQNPNLARAVGLERAQRLGAGGAGNGNRTRTPCGERF